MFRIVTLVVLTFIKLTHSFSDVGKWDLPMSGENCEFTLAKSVFKNSKVIVILHCDVAATIKVQYQFWPTPCSPDYFHYFEQRIVSCQPDQPSSWAQEKKALVVTCNKKSSIVLTDPDKSTAQTQISTAPTQVQPQQLPKVIQPLINIDIEGIYQLRMKVSAEKAFNATMQVEIVGPNGQYLSGAIWPLLPFFGVMCGVYTVLSALWLLVCGLQWRDLLRIQYWIGGVALLGCVESSVYYAVYYDINNSGYFNAHVYMFAKWVSVAKRALARMLVIIVSLGFGIVKPRLGPALQRVAGVGLLWAALAALEAWLRLHHKAEDSNRDLLLSDAPLSLLDSAICWWVFVSLAHTMRTLQLRRNTIKLSLYRHFTNTLIFAVVSSVIFMLYSIKRYRGSCIEAWKEVWMDEAYWDVLFASVLAVIMVLWRPTNNNQRYAFTPLLDNADDDDEEEEEQFVNDAYGVKMRGSNSNDSPAERRESKEENTLDSDLRWVEENIPTSSLPLLDSDEEIINTKFEVSKMQ